MLNNAEPLKPLLESLDESLRLKMIDVLVNSQKAGLGLNQVLTILDSFENDKRSVVPPLLSKIWECRSLSSIANGESLQRAYFSYCVSEGVLYFYGGRCRNKSANKALHKFNLLSNEIETELGWQGPGKRKGAALVLSSEALLLYGGKSGKRYLSDLWKFDLKLNKWSEIKTNGLKPLGREGCLVFPLGERLFIYGGGNKSQTFNDCFWVDLKNEICTSAEQSVCNEVLKARKKMAFCSVGLRVFIFGGLVENGDCCGSLDLFELWECFEIRVRKLPPRPPARHSATLNEFKGILILVGGKNTEKTFYDIWSYNIGSEHWEEIESYNSISSRSGHCCIVHNETLLIFGGWNNTHFSDNYLCTLSLSSITANPIQTQPNPISSVYPKRLSTQYCVRLPPRPKPDRSLDSTLKINENQFVHQLNLLPSDLKSQLSQYQNESCALLHICRTWVSLSISILIKSTVSFLQDKVCKLIPRNSLKKLFSLRRNRSDNEFHIRQKILNSWERVPTRQLNVLKIEIRPVMPQISFIYDAIRFPSILTPFFKISDIVVIVTRFEDYFSVFICKQVNEEFLIFYTIFSKNLQVVFPNEGLGSACVKNILVNTHFRSLKEITETRNIDVFLYTDKFVKSGENDIFDGDGNSLVKIMERSGDLDVNINRTRCTNRPLQKELLQCFNSYKVFRSTDPDFSVLMYYLGKLVHWKASKNSVQCFVIEITDISYINELTGLANSQLEEKILSSLTP